MKLQKNSRKEKLILLLSVFLLLISIGIWLMWLYIFQTNPAATQLEKIKRFHLFLPHFLDSNSRLSILVLVLSVVSLLLVVKNNKQQVGWMKLCHIIIIVFCALLLALQLFSMM